MVGSERGKSRTALVTGASRGIASDADGVGGTDASPARLAFRRFAITPPDGIAASWRAPVVPVALRKSARLNVLG